MATRRLITLSESPNAPTISALCDDHKVNGYWVPLLTADMLEVHYRDLGIFDPAGTWREVEVTFDDDAEAVRLHDCDLAGCRVGEPHDHSIDDRWAVEGLRSSAWIDGLAWLDATTADGEVA